MDHNPNYPVHFGRRRGDYVGSKGDRFLVDRAATDRSKHGEYLETSCDRSESGIKREFDGDNVDFFGSIKKQRPIHPPGEKYEFESGRSHFDGGMKQSRPIHPVERKSEFKKDRPNFCGNVAGKPRPIHPVLDRCRDGSKSKERNVKGNEDDDEADRGLRISTTPTLPRDGYTAKVISDCECNPVEVNSKAKNETSPHNSNQVSSIHQTGGLTLDICAMWRKRSEDLEAQLNAEIDRHIDSKRLCADLQNRNSELEETISTMKEAISTMTETITMMKEKRPSLFSEPDSPTRYDGLLISPRHDIDYRSNRPRSPSMDFAAQFSPYLPDQSPPRSDYSGHYESSVDTDRPGPGYIRPPAPLPLLQLRISPSEIRTAHREPLRRDRRGPSFPRSSMTGKRRQRSRWND